MIFTQEGIYAQAGQFDKIVTVSFRPESDSSREYGNWITGEFLYYPQERLKLENKPSKIESLSESVRFLYRSNDLSPEKIKKLEKEGIPLADISNIMVMAFEQVNKFIQPEKRKLPLTTLKIEVDFSEIDDVKFTIKIHNDAYKMGFLQAPHEDEEFFAACLIDNQGVLETELREMINDDVRINPNNVQLHYLRFKKRRTGLTEEEFKEIGILYRQRDAERVSILAQELKSATSGMKQPKTASEKYLQTLLTFVYTFHDETLLRGKYPVWWDFNRFIHIYLGHIDILQLGNKKIKTPFQYKPEEIKDLIKVILRNESEEIQRHLGDGSGYNREGKRSVYYNGDYYTIRISEAGRLMTFFKMQVYTHSD